MHRFDRDASGAALAFEEMCARKQWPDRAALESFGLGACDLRKATVRAVLGRVADAVRRIRRRIKALAGKEREYRPLCERMITAWDEGLASLEPR